MSATDIEAFSRVIEIGDPVFDAADRQLICAMYDALASGEPVSISQLAEILRRSVDEVSATTERCNIQYADDRVVGFGGLSLEPTDHIFEVRVKRLYTWCAWDPLFIAPILGEEARVETTCPVTGEKVGLKVGPDGIRDLSPSTAVLSMRIPDESYKTNTIANFCSFVLLFASESAARAWIAERPGFFVVDVDRGFDLGRLLEQRAC